MQGGESVCCWRDTLSGIRGKTTIVPVFKMEVLFRVVPLRYIYLVDAFIQSDVQ
uniref:Uncharacterized protein n=1 Tax=Anguilla anguilla TaxID=7936 RepID=A0A0E9W6V5_ANGAN